MSQVLVDLGTEIGSALGADATRTEVAQGELTTELPANTVLLAPHMHANNGGTAAALRWDFVHLFMYI